MIDQSAIPALNLFHPVIGDWFRNRVGEPTAAQSDAWPVIAEKRPVAYAHHGSLSREIRYAVEQNLKNGELKAIVATNSLEMGIDIGALDEVINIQSPHSISSAIQRIGRAGHQVGAVSRGILMPSHPHDFLVSAESHVRELKPRISIDRLENSVTARPGALQALYLSGGTIPDRGYYQMRMEDNFGHIGELDEEFVWEARVGQVFTLGTQSWRIRKITHNDVIVQPTAATGVTPPFWKGEGLDRVLFRETSSFCTLIGVDG